MKKTLLFLLTMFLISCTNNHYKKDSTTYDYSDVEHLIIRSNDIFSMQNSLYFVYFYQLNCLHCIMLKQHIINYALSDKVTTYFVEFDETIQIVNDVSLTIGSDDIESFGILGTPSLVLIKEHKVFLNVAGEELIKSILNEYN